MIAGDLSRSGDSTNYIENWLAADSEIVVVKTREVQISNPFDLD